MNWKLIHFKPTALSRINVIVIISTFKRIFLKRGQNHELYLYELVKLDTSIYNLKYTVIWFSDSWIKTERNNVCYVTKLMKKHLLALSTVEELKNCLLIQKLPAPVLPYIMYSQNKVPLILVYFELFKVRDDKSSSLDFIIFFSLLLWACLLDVVLRSLSESRFEADSV